ncbi:MAG: DegT/DnrJ/EryC1/StrS family aminotransferase [Chloroflexota bacterium]
MTQISEKLAADGGEPAQTLPWPGDYAGAAFIGDEERRHVLEVLDRQTLFRFYGPQTPDKVAQLEREFAARIGSKWALAVTSGTAALKVALAAVGVGPGDEVIVPAITFIASAGAVLAHGAHCVFAEVDDSLGLDPADVALKITSRTKAIMPVHLGGVACDMDPLLAAARVRGVPIVEDCAQSAGCSYKGKPIGSLGTAGAFSLQTQKIITAGEGGFVTTSDPLVYERAFRYHDHGGYRFGRQGVTVSGSTAAAGSSDSDSAPPPAAALDPFVGEVYRMGELTGAVALAQLRKLDLILEACRRHKRRLTEGIDGLPGFSLRHLPDPDGDCGTRFGFVVDDPAKSEAFGKALRAEGVPTHRVYGGKPVYAEPQILHRRSHTGATIAPDAPAYSLGMCPRTEALLQRAYTLPIHPHLTDAHLNGTVRAFEKVTASLF